jgi:hypothetical protein
MRGILFAMLVAAGLGLAGSANVSAAPISGPGILNAAGTMDSVEQVQFWRWGHGRWRSHYRWGSRGGIGRRCHVPFRSWWRWC